MSPVVRDTLSLRPQGVYAFAFLAARAAEMVSLIIIIGIVSHFLSVTTRGDKDAPATLVAIILFTSASLLWTLLSWAGYSRRYLPYPVTWAVDLVLLIPFLILTIVLGLPLDDTQCGAVSATGKFEIAAPRGTEVGRIVFVRDGRAQCVKLFVVWGFLVGLCVLFAVSALAVGFLDLGERQLNKAIFAVREERGGGGVGVGGGSGVGGGGGGYYYGQQQEMGQSGGGGGGGGRGFTPTPRPQPPAGGRIQRSGVDEYGRPITPSRPSVAEDRLNLNRPTTLAPGRAGDRGPAGGYGYDERYAQPAPARMPRQRVDDDGYGMRETYRAG